MRVLVIVQARTGSTRLPGKTLFPLAGAPLLQRQLERILAARTQFDVVVATTTEGADQPIRDLCVAIGVNCFSGHPTDLLDRHYRCALERRAEVVVKIPSDCPLIDPDVIDLVLTKFLMAYPRYDYVSNLHPPTFPDGNDVEVMKFSALEYAWREASLQIEREHTTPYIVAHPDIFIIENVELSTGEDYSRTHRWTIDYEEDFVFVSAIYNALWRGGRPVFSMQEILELVHAKPELYRINLMHLGKAWYNSHRGYSLLNIPAGSVISARAETLNSKL